VIVQSQCNANTSSQAFSTSSQAVQRIEPAVQSHHVASRQSSQSVQQPKLPSLVVHRYERRKELSLLFKVSAISQKPLPSLQYTVTSGAKN
jgi:hypothetical protein